MTTNDNITIQSLSCTDIQVLRNCFNACFQHYYVPIYLSREQFIEKITTEAIDLKLSFGMFDNDELIGFLLHGIDNVGAQQIAYNAGIGILPEYRGRKLSYQLYEHGVLQLKKAGITKTVLEVIEQNTAAIKTYEHLGFSVTRRLNSYQGKPRIPELAPIEIETLSAPDWELIKKNCEWIPSWQYNTNCIKRAQSNYTLQVVKYEEHTIAYCIANFTTGRIAHFGCSSIEYKEKYLSALFNQVNGVNADHYTSVLNVDTNALYANTFLLSIGLSRSSTACEMEMAL